MRAWSEMRAQWLRSSVRSARLHALSALARISIATSLTCEHARRLRRERCEHCELNARTTASVASTQYERSNVRNVFAQLASIGHRLWSESRLQPLTLTPLRPKEAKGMDNIGPGPAWKESGGGGGRPAGSASPAPEPSSPSKAAKAGPEK